MTEAENGASEAPSGPVIAIKKYANRRLYNTATSSYVTLDDLALMVKKGAQFVVTDAKTGEDITRSVLTQIIVEQEGKGQNLLPIKFLRQVIGFYGDSLGGLVPRYLEQSMESFAQNESQMRKMMQETFKGMGLFPLNRMEEIGKQNMAMFETAMKMFNPFAPARAPSANAGGSGESAAPSAAKGAEIDALKAQINAMNEQLQKLSKGQ